MRTFFSFFYILFNKHWSGTPGYRAHLPGADSHQKASISLLGRLLQYAAGEPARKAGWRHEAGWGHAIFPIYCSACCLTRLVTQFHFEIHHHCIS